MNWQDNIIEDNQGIRDLLDHTSRIAVLGIRSELHKDRPAFYVPQYLAAAGLEVIGSVYEPEVKEILGQKVYRKLSDIPGELDLVMFSQERRH